MDTEKVKTLARRGRVAPDPSYHAYQHEVKFRDAAFALTWCYRVEKDERLDDDGSFRHPNGYVAWCDYKAGRELRVDLNVERLDDGELLLIVTAMEVP